MKKRKKKITEKKFPRVEISGLGRLDAYNFMIPEVYTGRVLSGYKNYPYHTIFYTFLPRSTLVIHTISAASSIAEKIIGGNRDVYEERTCVK